MEEHYQKLVHMYGTALIQKKYPGIHLEIKHQFAKITLPIDESYHHAGHNMHGSVYFRLLDDVSYFAAMSEEKEYFYVTRSFNITFIRPFEKGLVTAISDEIKWVDGDFIASATLYNEAGKKLAVGEGVFSKSKTKLNPEVGYRLA